MTTTGVVSDVFEGAFVDSVAGVTAGSTESSAEGVFSCAVCCCAENGEDTVAPPQPATVRKTVVARTNEFNRHRRENLFTFIAIHNPMGLRQSNQQNRLHRMVKRGMTVADSLCSIRWESVLIFVLLLFALLRQLISVDEN